MKISGYLLLLTFLLQSLVQAQRKSLRYNAAVHSLKILPGIITLDVKKDFGAAGNGLPNLTDSNRSTADHEAFEKAAEFINARGGYVTLVVPPGNYITGKQFFTKGQLNHYKEFGWGEPASFDGYDLLLIRNCKNVTLQGTISKTGAKPVIQFRKNLKFGLFNTSNGSTAPSITNGANSKIFVDPEKRQRAHPGDCIKIISCDGVKISNIIIDGNIGAFKLGGKYGIGTAPYENYHSGIYIINTTNTLLLGITIKNMGLDGIVIKDNNNGSVFTKNIELRDCSVLKNGRNGLSWLSGVNVKVINCEFSNMGTGVVSTEPCAGIDIEGETESDESIPSRGFFKNCTIKDNKWLGLAAGIAYINGKFLRSRSMHFDSCLFVGSKNTIADIESDNYQFTNCKFYGMLFLRNKAETGMETTFDNCDFSNMYNNKKMAGGFLIVNNAAKRTSFLRSRFTSYGERIFLMDNTGFACGDYKNYPLFERCTFKNYVDSIRDGWVKAAGLGSKSSFKNNTFYYSKNYPFLTDTYHGNMCAQDLGGNSYYELNRKDVQSALKK